MKTIKNNRGIALVTALMLTLISLTIIMAALYLLCRGTLTSAATKKYNSAMEASYGGVEFFTKDALPELLEAASGGAFAKTAITNLYSANPALNLTMSANVTDACMQIKLTKPSSDWAANDCTADNITSDISQLNNNITHKSTFDLRFTLPGQPGTSGYNVYTKLVETKEGNTDTTKLGSSGALLVGSGVARSESQGRGGASGPATKIPYLFTLQVQGEAASNPLEEKKLTVLYAH